MAFSQSEIDNAVEYQGYFGPAVIFQSPVSPRENVRLNYRHQGLWIPSHQDRAWFTPSVFADNEARAFIMEEGRMLEGRGGKDIFGIEWEFVPSAMGSIVRPGNPTLRDITAWRDVITFPDVKAWDWEASGRLNENYLRNSPAYQNFCIFTGWFERLISFMDFGPAAAAVMRKNTRPYAVELFEKFTDLWIEVADMVKATYGDLVDGIAIHDDWGAQDGPFFNEKIVRETLVPAMKRFTDHCHALGYTTELHSCGRLGNLIGCIADAGFDSWDGMAINDYPAAYEKWGDRLMMFVPAEEGKGPEDYAALYCNRDKPVYLSSYASVTADYIKELYRISRTEFDKQ